jgi:uncharacterized protein
VGKYLLIVLIAVVVYLIVRGFRRPTGSTVNSAKGPEGERMVSCSHCGVFLPQSEAVTSGGQHFCCDEHRRLAGR